MFPSSKRQSNDPFWMVHDPNNEPLDPSNPTVDIFLPLFKGREKFENKTVVIASADRVLFNATMVGGRIRGKVDPESASLPDWKGQIKVRLTAVQGQGRSTPGMLFRNGNLIEDPAEVEHASVAVHAR